MQPKKKRFKRKDQKSQAPAGNEVSELEGRIQVECPQLLQQDPNESSTMPEATFQTFPLSRATLKGLKGQSFEIPTPIQRRFIPQALLGGNIMAEAPTGSGKTIAFLVPLLELLYRSQFEPKMGIGTVVLTPTRELAAQIFSVLKAIGRYHVFSAMCLFGGQKQKSSHITSMLPSNIVVATPGRLLAQLDECRHFDTSLLQLLVLDEADLMVDMGFSETVSQILEHLPAATTRQTWLISATLTFAVNKLALFALQKPHKIIVKDGCLSKTSRVSDHNSERKLPKNSNGAQQNVVTAKAGPQASLQQIRHHYAFVKLEDQMNFLFSFLRANSQKKVLVFVNSCKQVRAVYEVFYRLKPGPAMLHLHGKQHQARRLQVLDALSKKARAVCLVATDVAARGLDIPNVDWVVQLNCPVDIETYIHRVGRTARYKALGDSLLCLLPSEAEFVTYLHDQKVNSPSGKLYYHQLPITLYELPKHKNLDITGKMASLLASNAELKNIVIRGLRNYFRSVCLARNKKVFKPAIVRSAIVDNIEMFGLAVCNEELLALGEDGVTKQKKLTKLERLKLKISEKKRSNQSAEIDCASPLTGVHSSLSKLQPGCSGEEGKPRAPTSVGGQSLKKSTLLDFSDDDDHDDFMIAAQAENVQPQSSLPDKITLSAEEQRKLNERIRKQQIRIRADGTAKIKGYAMLTPQSSDNSRHKFFNDDDEAVDSTLESHGAKAAEDTIAMSNSNLVDTYAQRLNILRDDLKAETGANEACAHREPPKKRLRVPPSDGKLGFVKVSRLKSGPMSTTLTADGPTDAVLDDSVIADEEEDWMTTNVRDEGLESLEQQLLSHLK